MARIKVDKFVKALDLEVLYSAGLNEIEVTTPDINRPGLALAGFFDYFTADRVQIIGKQEMTYLLTALDDDQRYNSMDALMAHAFPCLIISRGMEPPQGLMQLAVKYNHIVFRSKLVTNKLMNNLAGYLGLILAPQMTTHGVLVDVYGIGLMITGESGMGKSETALELLRRGHRLVADDLVEIRRLGTDQLIGSAPENIRHFMEIRGVGIINIRQMYGIGSVLIQKGIDMIARLEPWDQSKQYDRIGMEEDTEEILEVPLPKLIIPVIPGRNLAIIMEVAARNQRLKNMGYNSAIELQRLINEPMDGLGEV
jgi:HPr kinase/phosphorylase